MPLTGKVFDFRDFVSRWKRDTSSKHSQGFSSEDELLLLKGQQSMCKQDKHKGCPRPSAVLFPSRPAARHVMQLGYPFCKGEGGWGLLFKWALRMAFSTILCALLHGHPREQSHSLQARQWPNLWAVFCAPGTQKRHPNCPHEDHVFLSSTQSPKATATPAKSHAEFLHPDNQKTATAAFWSGWLPHFWTLF